MSEQPSPESVAPLRLALGMIFCAVAFHIFLAPHRLEGHTGFDRPPAWEFFCFPVMGGLLGFAIEAASRGLSNANLGKTARYLAWGAVLVLAVAWQRPAELRIPFGPSHYFAQPTPPWQFFYLFVGVLLGLAIEAAGLLRGAKFGTTNRSIMWWSVVGIMVAALTIECISEARAVHGFKNEGEDPQILVVEDFLRKLIVLPTAAVVGGGIGFLIRRHRARHDGMSDPITGNQHEPSSSRLVGVFGVLCGIAFAMVGSVLGGYVAPYIERREFPEIWAEFQSPLIFTFAGTLLGGCFGWLFGWLLAALVRRRDLRTRGDHILIWLFGLFPISVATAAIVLSGSSLTPDHWPPRGPDLTVELINSLFDHTAWLTIALVAYLLSSGPAYAFAIKHSSFLRPVELVYAPLFWVTGHCSPLRNAQHRYMEFWAVRHGTVNR